MSETHNQDDWPVISSYTTEQAEADGVIAKVGYLKSGEPVYFTTNLLAQGYEDMQKRIELVHRGLELLKHPDPEDTEYMRLRVIERDRAWVIYEPGKLTYLRPEDY